MNISLDDNFYNKVFDVRVKAKIYANRAINFAAVLKNSKAMNIQYYN